MYRIPRIKSTELKKINKPKGPGKYASIVLEMEKRAVSEGRERKGPGWQKGQEGRKGNMIRYGGLEQE